MLACWITESHYLAGKLPYYEKVPWFIFQPDYAPGTRWYIKLMSEIIRNILLSIGAYRLATKHGSNFGRKLVNIIVVVQVYFWIELFLYILCFQIYGQDLLLILTSVVIWWILLIKQSKHKCPK